MLLIANPQSLPEEATAGIQDPISDLPTTPRNIFHRPRTAGTAAATR
jgi:hypothetical protein